MITLKYVQEGEEEKEKDPALGTVEALYKEAEKARQAAKGEKGNEEAIRQVFLCPMRTALWIENILLYQALRQPKPQAQEKKEEEPEYESFQDEISDIGPKVKLKPNN
eukprot:jgi/Bigna1/137899/aug1.41_g12607